MRTTWGVATDKGQVRQLNEDAVLAQPPVFLVADGMGGYEAGDVASQLIVEVFGALGGRETVSPGDIHQRFEVAVQRLRAAIDAGSRAGATVAGAAIVEQDGAAYWLFFNIGDSRIYRCQEGRLEQISVDHSVAQELLEAGVIDDAEAASHPQRHQVTRALATHVRPDPDYWLMPTDFTDRILLCSDGLTTEVADGEIAQLMRAQHDPQQAADDLVNAAVLAGGRDNISAVVVDVVAEPPSQGVASAANGQIGCWPAGVEATTVPRNIRRRNS